MIQSQFVLPLNNLTSIIIDSFDALENLYPCNEVVVTLHHDNNEYNLAEDCVREVLASLYGLLSYAFKNNAHLHESIKHDVGYLWNEEMQDKPGLTYMKLESIDYWVGLRNLIWSTRSSAKLVLSTWLYNDSEESIILEITPSYPWHRKKPRRNEHFIPYDQWLQQYKPLAQFIISPTVALAWKDTIELVLEALEKNVAKHRST